MSLFKRLFGPDEPEEAPSGETAIEPVQDQSLALMSPGELAVLESSSRSVTLPSIERVAAAADALIPLAANATQTANELGMAVVKFPEGVGWADLCARKAPEWNGWKLLSSFDKDGKFNEMAGIRQAGLQPAAVANLALQGMAVAVGIAYMNQINEKLGNLQSSIETIQRDMERERDAELKAAYDALARLTLKYEEYGASAEKHQVGLQIIEDATREATKAWNYQIGCIKDFTAEVQGKKRLSAEKIVREAERLSSMEALAAVAFQLVVMAQQVGMRFEGDYTEKRIETDAQITDRMAEEFSSARGDARLKLSAKISKVGGKPLALADPQADDYVAKNAALAILHEVGENANRLNPVRMRSKAKADISEKRAKLQDAVSTENAVREISERNKKELETLRFAFNEADTLVIKTDSVILFKSEEAGPENDDGPAEKTA